MLLCPENRFEKKLIEAVKETSACVLEGRKSSDFFIVVMCVVNIKLFYIDYVASCIYVMIMLLF